MFVGSDTAFYFATIRKTTVAVTSLFNHIYVKRYTNPGGKGPILDTIRVPVSYASGEKWFVHKTQDIQAGTKVRTKIVLPRIGVKLVGFSYDSQRKLPTTNQISIPNPNDTNQILQSLNPVPYNFEYEVYIAVKNIDDGLQILEQILPVFQPSYNLTVKEIPELNVNRDIPVTLSSINMEDTFEGTFDEPRILQFVLSLTVAGYLYPTITDGEVIKKVITSLYSDKDLTQDSKNTMITVSVDPLSADIEDDWSVKTEIEYYDHRQLEFDFSPLHFSGSDFRTSTAS